MTREVAKLKRWVLLFGINYVISLADATRKASCNGWTLKAPDEGSFQCTPMGVTISMPGTRCTLYCDSGYRAQHEVLVCSETGGWVPSNTPECQADSTMTLVIVLSIVGSIVVVLALSVLYARTSRRCRGKRRKLEDDDPETANRRKEVNDTSTYYGQVKRIRRKRRLQVERQKKVTERQKRKEASLEKSKQVIKHPAGKSRRGGKRQSKATPKDTKRERTRTTKERPRTTTRSKISPRKKTQSKQRATPPKEEIPIKLQKKAQKNKTFQDRLNEIFCFPCATTSNIKNNNNKLESSDKNELKIISISGDLPSTARKPVKSSSESSSTSSASSSESSSSDEEPPKKIHDSKTPSSRPKKTPQKAPTPGKKNPPPRPPAPKHLPSRVPRTSSDSTDSSDSSADGAAARKGVSSGYSSEGDKLKRKRGHSDSAVRRNSEKDSPTRPQSAAASSGAKRMEILSTGQEDAEKITGNPYENYPAALSYRQYQNFENDYRRTTGDYHPQYSNVKLIPLETVKKIEEKEEGDEKGKTDVKESEKKTKSVLGGVKYIDISEEEEDETSDSGEPKKKRNRRKHAERYDDPAARDRRRNHTSKRAQGRSRKDKESRSESPSKRNRKKEIGGEKIIDDVKHKKKESEKKGTRQQSRGNEAVPKDRSEVDIHKQSDKSKRKKRPK